MTMPKSSIRSIFFRFFPEKRKLLVHEGDGYITPNQVQCGNGPLDNAKGQKRSTGPWMKIQACTDGAQLHHRRENVVHFQMCKVKETNSCVAKHGKGCCRRSRFESLTIDVVRASVKDVGRLTQLKTIAEWGITGVAPEQTKSAFFSHPLSQ
jgi:hypothetical protein